MTPALFLSLALTTPAADPDPRPPAPDVRAAVKKGLGWLAGQQKDDGSWTGTVYRMPTAMTATAGLAFLMEGSTPAAGKYAESIRKAIGWFEKNADAAGKLGGSGPDEQFNFVRPHAAAVVFLACAYDADTDEERRGRIKKVLDKAVAFLADCRGKHGGWCVGRARDLGDADDAHTTTLVLHALLTARKAGIDVPKELTNKAVEYLETCTGPDGGVHYTRAQRQGPMAAAAMPQLSAQAAGSVVGLDGPRPETLARWVAAGQKAGFVGKVVVGGSYGMLTYYQTARLAFALGEGGHRKLDARRPAAELTKWTEYRAKLFPAIKDAQAADGSWPDLNFGPAYSTALALCVLQLDNDYVPAFSR